MANGRSSHLTRAVTVALLVTLVAELGPVSPAAAAPAAGVSAIGTGPASARNEYRAANYLAADPDDVEIIDLVGAPPAACQLLPGEVPQDEIDRAVGREQPPTGEGAWRYEVCAATPGAAVAVARDYPSVAAARQHCEQPQEVCAVFVRWLPAAPTPIPPASQDGQQAYLESLFDFAPVLQTSPANDALHGLVAQLPAWFWNTVETRFPKAVPGGQAWHLWTEFHTDNQRACRRSGLNKVGTVWRRSDGIAPERPSPTGCGYTYQNQGRYVVRGCTRWLFIITALFAPIVFAVTFCDSDTMTVKEVQVVGGGGPRRRPVS